MRDIEGEERRERERRRKRRQSRVVAIKRVLNDESKRASVKEQSFGPSINEVGMSLLDCLPDRR